MVEMLGLRLSNYGGGARPISLEGKVSLSASFAVLHF
jgi:hypothetical protein